MSFNSWNQWFSFRRRLKIVQRLCGIPMIGVVSLPINYCILNSPWIDPSKLLFGMDPIVFAGLSIVTTGTIGYFVGCSLPLVYLKHFNHSLFMQHEARKGDFFQRICKLRANVSSDPSKLLSSVDFYGEGIGSVAQYRNWLRMHNQMKLSKKISP
jgi:import inner membrane translocase subunit TIM23